MNSARWLAAALCCAAAFCIQGQALGSSPEGEHQQTAPAANAANPLQTAQDRRLAREGESALAVGDAVAAQRAFERAALLVHSPEVEMGLVRSYMQAGDFRRALNFASHAAGAHRNVPAGTALYAWLLHISGQGRVAATMLAEAAQRAPDDPALREAGASLSEPWPMVAGVLAEVPGRAAPYAWGAAVPGTARVVGSGVIIDGGRAALVPTHLLDEARQVWIRNGLGQTSEASVEQRLEAVPFSVLRLAQPLAPRPTTRIAKREPFGGSPGYAIEYAPGPGDLAAWPLLRQGFFGSVPRDGGLRALGIDVPPGPRGGPIFDAAGRLAGIAMTDSAGRDRIVLVSQIGARLGDSEPEVAVSGTSPRMPIDEIYERALSATAQVILAR